MTKAKERSSRMSTGWWAFACQPYFALADLGSTDEQSSGALALRGDFEGDVVSDVEGVAAGGFKLGNRAGELAAMTLDRLAIHVSAAPGSV